MTPAEVWARLLESVADKPSISWVQSFDFKSLERGIVRLTPRPGQRELMKFVTQPRREQLGKLIESILGSPVRVEIEAMPSPAEAAGSSATSAGSASSTGGSGGTERTGGGMSAIQQAMSLPLVKQVMELFDAQVMDVRPESVPAEETPSAAPSAKEAPLMPPGQVLRPPADFEPDMEDE